MPISIPEVLGGLRQRLGTTKEAQTSMASEVRREVYVAMAVLADVLLTVSSEPLVAGQSRKSSAGRRFPDMRCRLVRRL